MKEKVVICVCTCKRPFMLQACLASLSKQEIPEGVAIEIVVVDNEAEPNNQDSIRVFASECPFPTHYAHERKPGIPRARNACLDKALEIGAGWIAFIDDDEVAAEDWISNLWKVCQETKSQIVAGRQIFIAPSPIPFWITSSKYTLTTTGKETILKRAVTNNVMFSSSIVIGGLRFDESIGMMGGEDIAFFIKARKLGYTIIGTDSAITYEHMHRERYTFAGILYRRYWTSASDVIADIISYGYLTPIVRKAHTIPIYVVFGLSILITSPLGFIGGLYLFKRWALLGGKLLAKGLGRLAAFFRLLPKPYSVVVGK